MESNTRQPGRFRRFWIRHRTAFWALHSVWALCTGVVVMVLARERYGFVPWVVLFLALTWGSTLVLGRRVASTSAAESEDDGPGVPRAADEFASYVMRTLYQETLFFLLPFYFYSMVPASPNVGFVVLLGGLALLSCLDLVFDRLLREWPVFGMIFFATVAFAAVNLVLPILLPVPPRTSTIVAALVALASAIPLSLRDTSRLEKALLALPTAAILAVAFYFPAFVPPAPLRLDTAVFSTSIDRSTLAPIDPLSSPAPVADVDGPIIAILEIFAPSNVPAAVAMEWRRDGELIRTSREIEITAHALGFRVWDSWRPASGVVPAGDYVVRVRTEDGRVFGRATLSLLP